MDPNMVACQNLHSLTSSPEFVHQLFQHLKEDNQQLKEDMAILKEKQKAQLEIKQLNAHIAILEAKLGDYSSVKAQQKATLEIQQYLHYLTSSPEFVPQRFQQLKEDNQQLKEDIAILKEKQKAQLAIKQLNAYIAILEGKLLFQHRNTPSCPLPSDPASLSQPNLETTSVSRQPVSPEAPANRAEADVRQT